MISEKFVKIAREVIIHIRKGNKLQRSGLFSETLTTCPLGVVCLNNGLSVSALKFQGASGNELYDFAHSLMNLNSDFEIGFDESVFSGKNEGTESYNIGWALGKQCDKRGWIE